MVAGIETPLMLIPKGLLYGRFPFLDLFIQEPNATVQTQPSWAKPLLLLGMERYVKDKKSSQE